MKKRNIGLLLLLALMSGATLAQPYYAWRLGAGAGGGAYSGDLSYRLPTTKVSWPAYQLLLGRVLSPSFDVEVNASWGTFSASDQATNWRGKLQTDNPNFDRGLNFQTRYRNASLLVQYKFNNGRWLSQYARLGPYLYAGGGATDFDVYGDPENDGSYQTRLSGRESGEDYPTTILAIPLGAGVKWRISDRLSADLRAGATYAFSDYLDHLKAGKGNDVYFNAGVSLQYHFDVGGDKFRAPLVYTGSDAPPITPVATSGNRSDLDSLDRIAPNLTIGIVQESQSKGLPGTPTRTESGQNPAPSVPNLAARQYDSQRVREHLQTQDQRAESATAHSRAKTSPEPIYRTDTVYLPSGNTQADSRYAPTGHDTANAGRQGQPQRTSDEQRRPDGMTNSNWQPYNAEASEARVQRLESQVADLSRQLDALRNERSGPAPMRLESKEEEVPRLRQDVNSFNRHLGTTRPYDANVEPLDREETTRRMNAMSDQLKALRDGRQTNDPSAQKKLDSLLVQVNRLTAQLNSMPAAALPAVANRASGTRNADSTFSGLGNAYQNNPDTTGQASPAPASATEDTLLNAVQEQLALLRESVAQLQRQFTATNAAPLKKKLPYGPLIIYYPVNSAAVNAADKQRLTVIANRLDSDSSAVVQIKGFTDQTGNAAYNLALSRKRAQSIRNYLVTSLGVAPERIIVNYFGQVQAADKKENPYDRRVELELYAAGQ